MKLLATLTMSAAILASTTVFSNAFAQEQTRPEVLNQQQVTQQKAQQVDSGEGPAMSGSSMSGRGTTSSSNLAYPQSCAGPVSYCNLYFGS